MLRETQQKDKNNANNEVHEKSNMSRGGRGNEASSMMSAKVGSRMPRAFENHSLFLNFVLYIASPFHMKKRRNKSRQKSRVATRVVRLCRNLSTSCRAFQPGRLSTPFREITANSEHLSLSLSRTHTYFHSCSCILTQQPKKSPSPIFFHPSYSSDTVFCVRFALSTIFLHLLPLDSLRVNV